MSLVIKIKHHKGFSAWNEVVKVLKGIDLDDAANTLH